MGRIPRGLAKVLTKFAKEHPNLKNEQITEKSKSEDPEADLIHDQLLHQGVVEAAEVDDEYDYENDD